MQRSCGQSSSCVRKTVSIKKARIAGGEREKQRNKRRGQIGLRWVSFIGH